MYFELAGVLFGRFLVDIRIAGWIMGLNYNAKLSSWREHTVSTFKEFSLLGKIGMFTDICNAQDIYNTQQ